MRPLTLMLAVPFVLAACAAPSPDIGAPIADALERVTPEVRLYHEHVTTLADPFFEGRLPGSRGITDAEAYIAFHFDRAGLQPAFDDGAWFQPFSFPANKGYNMPIQDTGDPPVQARNVGALIPGVGDLADELIVIGAHHDHLGRRHVDQRDRVQDIHPGADDNASGVAGVLLLARRLHDTLADDRRPRRTILFLTFSGEESGRFGSRHYLAHPIAPVATHRLMVNFDMIGRLKSGRVSVYGARPHPWLLATMERHAARSPLDVRLVRTPIAGSDHVGFEEAGVPVLFAIIAALHDDYHTTRDESWRICHVNATHVVNLFHDAIEELALEPALGASARDEHP